MPDSFPTERDLLCALLDAVMTLAERVCPGEQMQVTLLSATDDDFMHVIRGRQTKWIKADRLAQTAWDEENEHPALEQPVDR